MNLLAYLVDDEPLALDRLSRLLEHTGRVTILGSNTNPRVARQFLDANRVDVLFLDISMPAMSGFELLAGLTLQPNVVFTTAHDQYALKAFEVNSIDYLLKPIEPPDLERALNKVERLRGGPPSVGEFRKLFEEIAQSMQQRGSGYPDRIASRLAGKVCFIDLARVTHFYAEDKLTYAMADGKAYSIDETITDLAGRLDPQRFIRIHRATMINANWVREIAPSFGGSLVVRLKDSARTELTVARNRVPEVKTRLGA